MNLFPSMGGSGVLATRLGEHLADRGHIVHLVSYDRPIISRKRPGVHINLVGREDYPLFETIGQPYAMSLVSKMLELAANPGLDVIHVHYAIPHVLSAYAVSKITGLPWLVTLHGSDAHSLGWSPTFRLAMLRTLQDAGAVTTVSEFLKRRIQERIGFEGEVIVIPNFIDIDHFSPSNEFKLCLETGCITKEEEGVTANPDSEEILLLHVSNYREGKRVPGLIEAFRIIADSHPNAHLAIAGDGSERAEVEKRIESLGLRENVTLLGVRSDIRELMCCSDVFLLFSNVEGMPLTVIEAMACGLPVVATPVGGTPELLRAGQDGIMTEGLGEREYAQAVIELIENDSLRLKLAAAGRKRVEESFSAEAVVPIYEKILYEVVG